MTRPKKITRRDLCHVVGTRAMKLQPYRRAQAWALLASNIEALGEKDIPKFSDLIHAIRAATIHVTRKLKNTTP